MTTASFPAFDLGTCYADRMMTARPQGMSQDRHTLFMQFAEQVSGRALVMMEMACQHHDVAADLVQEALIALSDRYLHKPESEWTPLFYGILNRRLMDWRRQEIRRSQRFAWFGTRHTFDDDDDCSDPLLLIADDTQQDPSALLAAADDWQLVQQAIAQLPLRQQQAFLLRAWEDLDVRTTAQIMQCSEGSVKTHYSRAIAQLKLTLSEIAP